MKDYSFRDQLSWSEDRSGADDMETIRTLLVGCQNVRTATRSEQSYGIDYVATLAGGAPVFIDTKARAEGARRWWRTSQPELALELWSVVPSASAPNGKIGWTLSQRSRTDMVLFTFDPGDTDLCYLVGFQPLRLAFERFKAEWTVAYGKGGRGERQSSDGGRWESEALFVPAAVVLNAIREISRDVAEPQASLFA